LIWHFFFLCTHVFIFDIIKIEIFEKFSRLFDVYPAIKFPCICFRHKNRRRSRRGIVSSGWRNGGYLDSYSRPKFVQSRQIYCRSHSTTPHLGGRARRSRLHIILSGSDSLTIVYDGSWTTHARLHISHLSCSECIGGEAPATAGVAGSATM